MDGEDRELAALEKRLRAVAEPRMRREKLLADLEARQLEDSFALLRAVLARPGVPSPHLRLLREVLQDVLRIGGATRPLPGRLRRAWLRQAEAEHDAFLARLLQATGAAEVMDDPSAALPRDVAELPLGVRRSLARGVDLRMLEKLLLDPDAIVLDHLLRNPRITEKQVVAVASRRPISEAALQAIQKSPRFGIRPQVRLAIARNPFCPAELGIQLIGSLATADLRTMRRDGTLHASIREHAAEEIARRTQDPRTDEP